MTNEIAFTVTVLKETQYTINNKSEKEFTLALDYPEPNGIKEEG